jgi:hypothetical protein
VELVDRTKTSYIEWSAIIAGAVLAAATSFVLLTFGTAIGLSVTSPWPGSGLSTQAVTALAAFWTLVQQIGAFMAGGYVAGRMRSRWNEDREEADFRDGLHGGMVWAVGVAIGALLAASAVGATARTGAEVAGQAGAFSSDPMGSAIDALLRPAQLAQIAPAAKAEPSPPAGTPLPPRPASSQPSPEIQRAEIARLLTTAATTRDMPPQDRTYLAQLVAQRTGLSPQEADRRIADAITAAREATDKARRTAILAGLVTALALVISFAAAWWAAIQGGNQRDNKIPARIDISYRRRAPS